MLLRRHTFNDLFREFNRLQNETGSFFRAGDAPFSGAVPAVNVWEDADVVFAEADLPGVEVEKLDISVTEGNQLTIQGQRMPVEVANSVWHRQERACGQFTRTLTLPTLVNADMVEATYDAGVLRLKMPKAEAAKPRKIAVKSV